MGSIAYGICRSQAFICAVCDVELTCKHLSTHNDIFPIKPSMCTVGHRRWGWGLQLTSRWARTSRWKLLFQALGKMTPRYFPGSAGTVVTPATCLPLAFCHSVQSDQWDKAWDVTRVEEYSFPYLLVFFLFFPSKVAHIPKCNQSLPWKQQIAAYCA